MRLNKKQQTVCSSLFKISYNLFVFKYLNCFKIIVFMENNGRIVQNKLIQTHLNTYE